jgi:hypothetical protein
MSSNDDTARGGGGTVTAREIGATKAPLTKALQAELPKLSDDKAARIKAVQARK